MRVADFGGPAAVLIETYSDVTGERPMDGMPSGDRFVAAVDALCSARGAPSSLKVLRTQSSVLAPSFADFLHGRLPEGTPASLDPAHEYAMMRDTIDPRVVAHHADRLVAYVESSAADFIAHQGADAMSGRGSPVVFAALADGAAYFSEGLDLAGELRVLSTLTTAIDAYITLLARRRRFPRDFPFFVSHTKKFDALLDGADAPIIKRHAALAGGRFSSPTPPDLLELGLSLRLHAVQLASTAGDRELATGIAETLLEAADFYQETIDGLRPRLFLFSESRHQELILRARLHATMALAELSSETVVYPFIEGGIAYTGGRESLWQAAQAAAEKLDRFIITGIRDAYRSPRAIARFMRFSATRSSLMGDHAASLRSFAKIAYTSRFYGAISPLNFAEASFSSALEGRCAGETDEIFAARLRLASESLALYRSADHTGNLMVGSLCEASLALRIEEAMGRDPLHLVPRFLARVHGAYDRFNELFDRLKRCLPDSGPIRRHSFLNYYELARELGLWTMWLGGQIAKTGNPGDMRYVRRHAALAEEIKGRLAAMNEMMHRVKRPDVPRGGGGPAPAKAPVNGPVARSVIDRTMPGMVVGGAAFMGMAPVGLPMLAPMMTR